MKLVHWQGTNHGVRNSTKLKLSLSLATTFSLCSSFNRHATHLNSSCDTAHPALAFNIVISGLHILAAEKNRLVCYAKSTWIHCVSGERGNLHVSTHAGLLLAEAQPFCSAMWQHRATQPRLAGSEGNGSQQRSQVLPKPKFFHQYLSHGRQKVK